MHISWIDRLKDPLRDFVLRHAHSPRGAYVLAIVAALESIISPVPLEVVLGPFVVARPARWFFFASVAVCASVIGALIGYAIGAALFDVVGQQIVSLYHLSDDMQVAQELLQDHMFSATFISAFTPIPYKVFVLTAGVLGGPIGIFIFTSILGRGIRFFIFAYIVQRYGAFVARLVYRYFTLATVAVVFLLALLVAALYL